MIDLGLLGTIAKAVGASALEATIETACDQFQQFVQGVGLGTHNWFYTFTWKGKTLGTISFRIHKTRSKLNLNAAGHTWSFNLNELKKGCIGAVHAALALL